MMLPIISSFIAKHAPNTTGVYQVQKEKLNCIYDAIAEKKRAKERGRGSRSGNGLTERHTNRKELKNFYFLFVY
jgi:hypothetical protein